MPDGNGGRVVEWPSGRWMEKCQIFHGISPICHVSCRLVCDLRKGEAKACNTLITISERKCEEKALHSFQLRCKWKCINWVYPSIKLINSKFAWIVNNPRAQRTEHGARTTEQARGQDRTEQNRTGTGTGTLQSLQQGRVKVPVAPHEHTRTGGPELQGF